MKIDPNLKITGIITDIQRSSIHDGPELRTTVFLKGCQLKCAWCHNPETISFKPETMFYPEECIGCKKCEEGCYSGARVLCGQKRSVEDILNEIILDEPYYGERGGLTVSGGEPLCQPEFVNALLTICGQRNIHTAIETNLHIDWKNALPILKKCNFIMADLKLWEPAEHKKWTGVDNTLIKKNFILLDSLNIPFIIRTPIISGVNDKKSEITRIAHFAAGLKNLIYYELLSYNPLGISKSKALKEKYIRFNKVSKKTMLSLAEDAAGEGIRVYINNRSLESIVSGQGEDLESVNI